MNRYFALEDFACEGSDVILREMVMGWFQGATAAGAAAARDLRSREPNTDAKGVADAMGSAEEAHLWDAVTAHLEESLALKRTFTTTSAYPNAMCTAVAMDCLEHFASIFPAHSKLLAVVCVGLPIVDRSSPLPRHPRSTSLPAHRRGRQLPGALALGIHLSRGDGTSCGVTYLL